MRKALYATAATLAVLLTVIAYLVFSHSGNAFLWRQIVQRMDALSGEMVEGNLLSGWTIRDLLWETPSLKFSSDTLTLHWQFSALLDKKLPVSLIDIERPAIEIFPSTPEPSSEPKQQTSIEVPLDISIEQINIQNLSFKSEAAEVFLDSFSGELTLNSKGLFLNQLDINQLNVHIVSSTETATQATTAPKSIALPNIELPLSIYLNRLRLNEGYYQQGNIKEKISNLLLSANGEGSRLSDIQLYLDHSLASATLSADIDLAATYPLSATLEATVHKPLLQGELENQQIKLHAAGALDNLQFELDAAGPVNANIRGSVQPILPDLPFDISLSWKTLNWPPLSKPKQVTAKNGSLIIAGNLKGYDIRLDTHLEVPRQPATSITLTGNGNFEQLTIKSLRLNAPDGYLNLEGQLHWHKQISWRGKTTLVDLNPKYWAPALPGHLNGNVTTHFQLKNNQWAVDIPSLSIQGSLRQYPLAVTGKASVQQASKGALPIAANIDHLQARIGQNTITANGSLGSQWNLRSQINAPELKEFYSEIQGSIKGDLEFSGSALIPTVDFYLTSPELIFRQFNLSSLDANGHITKGTDIAGEIELTIKELSSPQLSQNNLQLQARGNEQQHQLRFSSEGDLFAANISLKGSWDKKQWQGQLDQTDVKTPLDVWKLEMPLQITANLQKQLTLSRQCWVSREARFCVDPASLSPAKGTVLFRLAQFDLTRLASFYPEGFDWKSVLSAQGKVQWQNNQPDISVQLKTQPGTVYSGELAFDYNQLEVLANLRQQRLSSSVKFQSRQLGLADIELAVDDIAKERTLSGNVLLEKLRLDFLAGLIPNIGKLDGELSAKAQLGGTLKKPLMYGKLSISDGEISTREDIVSISQLTTHLNIRGDKGVIDGSMKVGDGTLHLGGQLSWQQLPPTGYITLKGDSVELAYPGYLQARVSPDLRFALYKGMELKGRIVIPWARIEIKELPQSAVKVSEDAVIVTDDEHAEQARSAPFNVNVDIVLGDDIRLKAYGLKTGLEGHLKLQQKAGQALGGHGSIQLLEGRYRYFGQDLLIEEGNIIFSGPLTNPYLMVDAIRNPETVQGDVKVGIKVNGSISRPEWEVYTSPAMSQQEQLSYLLRGRGLENGDDSGLQSLLIGAGVSQFGGVVSSVGEAIGFSDVTLDTEGSGSDTQVTIGGNIAPGLRLQYGAGVFKPIAEIKIRYELMPRLYLQAVSGLAQAVDLFYQFRIDTSRKAAGRPGYVPEQPARKGS